MRSAAIFVLLGLGAFAVATGLVLQLYSYPALAKVSHDIDAVSVSQGDGITALVYAPDGDSVLPQIRHNLSLTATSHVEGDLSQPEIKQGGDITVWTRSTIVKEDTEGLTLSAEVRRMCVNRHTGESVAPCHGQYYETQQGKRMTAEGDKLLQPGLSFVFPFNTEQRDYLWYDTVLEKPRFIRFDGQETMKGLEVYRFVQIVPPTQVGQFAVPGNMIGRSEPSVDVAQYYEVTRTLWVEPTTGAVVSARDDARQELRTPEQGEGQGTAVFDGVLQLNDKSVTWNADTLKKNLPMLSMITTLPVVLWITGGVLVLIALLLLIFRRSRGWGVGTLVGVVLAVLIGSGVASGVTVAVTTMNNPDSKLDLRTPSSSSGTGGHVDYGVR
ncbi:DUF3068 domain-containing protein [Lentzea tibetensis]|uniref:DUF3068 domain-containing protein n=1 Tax=Lentzea tibetensis TaxID=2591470 RepID=UPI00164946BA|nr:DUF3068 domain-containing protein [Lentzea tibetensis]